VISPIVKLAASPWRVDFVTVDAKTLTAGLPKAPKDLRVAAKQAIARLSTRKLPEIGLNRASGPQCEALASFWAQRSPMFAVDVAVRASQLAIAASDERVVIAPWPSAQQMRAQLVAMSGEQLPVQPFRGLRHVLASSDVAPYAEAKDRAAKHRAKLAPPFRCMVSFAFPEERNWAEEDAAEALAHGSVPKYVTPLLATKLLPAKRIVQSLPDEHYALAFIADAVEIHGAASRGIFAPLLEKKPRTTADRRALTAALE
jgi:hypothetical protein